MTVGSWVHVCCPRVFSSRAYNWMEYHVLSIGLLCTRALCARCASHVLRHLHVFVKIQTVHEIKCLWSVFRFLWFEDFNLPDVSRQSRLKLALLNETSMCWYVDISRNRCHLGSIYISITRANLWYPYLVCKKRFSTIFTSADKTFLAYPTGISMNPTVARKYRLTCTRGCLRRLSCMMSGRRLWRFDVILQVLTSCWRHFLPNVQ